jgi:predicted PurR-regulated permease PerM
MNRRMIGILVVIALLLVLIWYFSGIFFYVVFSLIFATVLRPVVNSISRFEILGYPIPKFISIFIAFLGLLLLFSAFALVFVPLLADQIQVISHLDINEVTERLMVPIKSFEDFLIAKKLTKKEPGFIVDGLSNTFATYGSNIDFAALFNNLLSMTGSLFIGLMAISFITFFLLYEQGLLRRNFLALVPNKYFEIVVNALHKIEKLLSNYLLGLLLQAIIIFTLASIGLSVVGVKYAMTIALFAAVSNVIPYLGPLLGSAFGIFVAVSTGLSSEFSAEITNMILKVVGVFVVVQVIDNVLIQPLIFSKGMKAHPLEIFVIIFVGATIAGIPGMIGAIPVYTILRVSVSELYAGYKRYLVFRT